MSDDRRLPRARPLRRGDLIRFVTSSRHPPYGHRSGIFRVAYALCRTNELAAADIEEIRGLLDWFNDHLARPERLAASRHPRAQGTGVSWIRASADEHLRRLRRLTAILDAAGIAVEELRTMHPGYILYEDAHQVVALPFADTPR
jgi:hypothetical protein